MRIVWAFVSTLCVLMYHVCALAVAYVRYGFVQLWVWCRAFEAWLAVPENRKWVKHTRHIDFWTGKRATPWLTDEEVMSAVAPRQNNR